jgi:hypothetical protein
VAALALGAFLIARAVVELLTVDFSDPSSYEHDWGGPTLVGVLAVHCLPGLLAAAIVFVVWRRSRARP